MEKKTKIIVLWLLTICGFACHSITDILPMFWGKDIAIATDGVVPGGMVAFMMLLSFFLPPGGLFIACYYVKGQSRISDWLVNAVLSQKGWFTPPFETAERLRSRIEKQYTIKEFHLDGSIVYFKATKH